MTKTEKLDFFAKIVLTTSSQYDRIIDVAGKHPGRHKGYAAVAHLVERHLAKVEVASSSLVGRSTCVEV